MRHSAHNVPEIYLTHYAIVTSAYCSFEFLSQIQINYCLNIEHKQNKRKKGLSFRGRQKSKLTVGVAVGIK